MNVDTQKMSEYADFLEESSRRVVALCQKLETNLAVAVQCMDQQSGRLAAQRMAQNLETIRNSVPINDDAVQRLTLARKYIQNAGNIFGR